MNKFVTNLIVATAAFLIGLASASALNRNGSQELNGAISNCQSDALGNLCTNQD